MATLSFLAQLHGKAVNLAASLAEMTERAGRFRDSLAKAQDDAAPAEAAAGEIAAAVESTLGRELGRVLGELQVERSARFAAECDLAQATAHAADVEFQRDEAAATAEAWDDQRVPGTASTSAPEPVRRRSRSPHGAFPSHVPFRRRGGRARRASDVMQGPEWSAAMKADPNWYPAGWKLHPAPSQVADQKGL